MFQFSKINIQNVICVSRAFFIGIHILRILVVRKRNKGKGRAQSYSQIQSVAGRNGEHSGRFTVAKVFSFLWSILPLFIGLS